MFVCFVALLKTTYVWIKTYAATYFICKINSKRYFCSNIYGFSRGKYKTERKYLSLHNCFLVAKAKKEIFSSVNRGGVPIFSYCFDFIDACISPIQSSFEQKCIMCRLFKFCAFYFASDRMPNIFISPYVKHIRKILIRHFFVRCIFIL